EIAFSHDPQQRFLYIADGHDKKVFILRRDTLEVVSSFGDGGRMPGQFYGVGSIAVDSKGNRDRRQNYEGKHVASIVYKGFGDKSVPRAVASVFPSTCPLMESRSLPLAVLIRYDSLRVADRRML